jgi:hypothetical protein
MNDMYTWVIRKLKLTYIIADQFDKSERSKPFGPQFRGLLGSGVRVHEQSVFQPYIISS